MIIFVCMRPSSTSGALNQAHDGGCSLRPNGVDLTDLFNSLLANLALAGDLQV